ncbi:ubiquinol-cytochrome c reductase complex ubiquinone-binding protein [Colletotrichum chrysophilum]|uniref:Ubiquinol-cytochrome c reductase complex ubiquinone-binding protein n=1 Tax=Colletotrichum chrysophilum TaxID=1836956 RepID=A0AAD9E8E9_9PEZI|nr:ubiquinol-cytochrome c reductase complex ubiquinone-binding protein [Colletotrichum chrysophilum]
MANDDSDMVERCTKDGAWESKWTMMGKWRTMKIADQTMRDGTIIWQEHVTDNVQVARSREASSPTVLPLTARTPSPVPPTTPSSTPGAASAPRFSTSCLPLLPAGTSWTGPPTGRSPCSLPDEAPQTLKERLSTNTRHSNHYLNSKQGRAEFGDSEE